MLEILPLLLTALSIVAAYWNININLAKREKERDQDLKTYVDKEIQHVKNLHNIEIHNLNQKLDKLIDLVEKLRDREV